MKPSKTQPPGHDFKASNALLALCATWRKNAKQLINQAEEMEDHPHSSQIWRAVAFCLCDCAKELESIKELSERPKTE